MRFPGECNLHFTLYFIHQTNYATDRCLMAYSMVINPLSPIKLVQRIIGPHGPRGFGIIAQRSIQKNEYIYELPGMIAKTSRPSIQSNLSIIIPHHRQRQGTEERVFFGPLRFVNHMCKEYNIMVSYY